MAYAYKTNPDNQSTVYSGQIVAQDIAVTADGADTISADDAITMTFKVADTVPVTHAVPGEDTATRTANLVIDPDDATTGTATFYYAVTAEDKYTLTYILAKDPANVQTLKCNVTPSVNVTTKSVGNPLLTVSATPQQPIEGGDNQISYIATVTDDTLAPVQNYDVYWMLQDGTLSVPEYGTFYEYDGATYTALQPIALQAGNNTLYLYRTTTADDGVATLCFVPGSIMGSTQVKIMANAKLTYTFPTITVYDPNPNHSTISIFAPYFTITPMVGNVVNLDAMPDPLEVKIEYLFPVNSDMITLISNGITVQQTSWGSISKNNATVTMPKNSIRLTDDPLPTNALMYIVTQNTGAVATSGTYSYMATGHNQNTSPLDTDAKYPASEIEIVGDYITSDKLGDAVSVKIPLDVNIKAGDSYVYTAFFNGYSVGTNIVISNTYTPDDYITIVADDITAKFIEVAIPSVYFYGYAEATPSGSAQSFYFQHYIKNATTELVTTYVYSSKYLVTVGPGSVG